MKLYHVIERVGMKIRLVEDADVPPAHKAVRAGEVLTFSHIDGMYSLCYDSEGDIVHIAAWSEVEVIKNP